MAVDGPTVILIICMGAYKGVCYGLRVSRMDPPSIIEIDTNSLHLIPNKSPTKETFKDPTHTSNFLPGRSVGTKHVTRALPIRLDMLLLLLDPHPPRYFVDLVNKGSAAIDKESTMYNWFCAAATWDEQNHDHSALQLRFSVCTELTYEYGTTMLGDLDEAFDDKGAIGSLIRRWCLSLPAQQQATAGSLNQNHQVGNVVDATTTETATTMLVQQQTLTQPQQHTQQPNQQQQQQKHQYQQPHQTYQPPLNQQQPQQQITQTTPNQQQHTQHHHQQQQQSQQGIIGHQLGMNTGTQAGFSTMAQNPSMLPGMQSLGMQQGTFPNMPHNPNVLSGM